MTVDIGGARVVLDAPIIPPPDLLSPESVLAVTLAFSTLLLVPEEVGRAVPWKIKL